MDQPADLQAGLVAYLSAQSGVAFLVGDRVFGGELPSEEAAFMPRRALVIRLSGGVSLTGESTLDHDTQRFDVFSYGKTPLQAGTVMSQADHALRSLTRGVWADCLIHRVNSAGGASQGREPVTEWPRHFRSYQALHGLTQVSA